MTSAAAALPESWQPFASDARAPIPGDVVRKVGDFHVHRIHGVDYLSIGTVSRILRFGDLSHIPEQYLEPARARGQAVGEWIAEILAHDPTHGRYFSRILAKLGDDVIPVALRPYLMAAAMFIDDNDYHGIVTEQLYLDRELGVFGYRDAYGTDREGAALCCDWKTGKSIYVANRWQVTFYTPEGERGVLVQLGKDYVETPCCTDDDRRQLAAAAELAHLYIAERGGKRKRA